MNITPLERSVISLLDKVIESMTNWNWKEIGSFISAGLTVVCGLYLGQAGYLPWGQALPIILAGLAILGIHPGVNTTTNL